MYSRAEITRHGSQASAHQAPCERDGKRPPIKICFVETQSSEGAFFTAEFKGCEVQFSATAAKVNPDTEILSVYIHTQIGAEFLDAHSLLRLITLRSTGYDHVNLAECNERGVTVCNVSGSDANTVAEHTFALMLAAARRLQEVGEANKQTHFSYEQFRGFDLNSKTLGVIGAGRIGLRTIHIALAFGMRVLACEPYRPSMMAEILGVRYVALDELLQCSQVISLHAPLTPETFHLLNRETLARCRPGVIIINTARGGLIDTDALIEALDNGTVAGIGIDVLEEESVMQREASRIIADNIIEHLHAETTPEEARMKNPERVKEIENLMRNQQLLKRPNVVFTPHVAFNSIEAVERINTTTVENIRAFLASAPINVVTPASSVGGDR